MIRPAPGDVFLDVGAGDGSLSARLAPAVRRLVAIELDGGLIPVLERNLAPFPSATVVRADILELDIPAILAAAGESGAPFRVAGNLPYYIATAIIERLLRSDLAVTDMTFMVQLEVAQRISASPGSRQYGYLTVFCRHFADVRLALKVPAGCFVPRPKVTSAVVTFVPRPERLLPEDDALVRIAKAAFAHRRKTVANSLARDPRLGPVAGQLLEAAGIDGSRRAEEIYVEEFERMAAALTAL